MKKLLALAVVILGFTAVSFGQNSVTTSATSSATIIGPLSVTKTNNLDFGSIVPGVAASNVVISTTAAATRTPDGTTTCIGTFSNVKFSVGGQSGSSYSINYPATVDLTNGAAPKMVATLTCSTGKTGNSITSVPDFYIGGSLAVGTKAAQTAGVYTNAGFNVVVAYE